MKHLNVTRLAFDRAQVNDMSKVLRNNFDYPKICLFSSLKLWNEVPSNKFQTSLPQK